MRYVITAVALLSAVAPAAAQSPEAAVLVKQAAEHQATVERSAPERADQRRGEADEGGAVLR